MEILIRIFILHIKIIYSIFKLLPVDSHKVVFLSRNFDTPPLDFRLLENELNKNFTGYKTVFLTRRIRGGIPNMIGYYFHIIRQLFHIATTNVCVIDSYIIPISVLNHRKDLRVIQIWHSMGAIKKFGYQTLGTRYGRDTKLSSLLHMHEKYDVIVSGSYDMIPYYCEAFNTPSEHFFPVGLPRIDYIVGSKDDIQRRIYGKYPELKQKPVILYVPTFRPEIDDGINRLIESVDFDKHTLIIKKHPNDQREFKDNRVTNIQGFSALELLTVADHIITDYSAISIEASALLKCVYFYVYDYDKYIESNGLNIDLYNEMPGCVFKNADKLMKKINHGSYDFKSIRDFRDKYVVNNGYSAQIISALIDECANRVWSGNIEQLRRKYDKVPETVD
ncbi:MAG: CDP-glycerol glycerophosphotransferase family protein [Oscillospiraceae bacterium]|nr:CDP-glycerol glycerophosphotransferase family protein [Oscillospiraceae bacterium]